MLLYMADQNLEYELRKIRKLLEAIEVALYAILNAVKK